MPFGFATLSFFIAFFIVLFIPLVVTSPDESDSDSEEPVVTLGVGPSIFLVAIKRFWNSVTICKLFIAR